MANRFQQFVEEKKKNRFAQFATPTEEETTASALYSPGSLGERYSQLAEDVKPADYSGVTEVLGKVWEPVSRAGELIAKDWRMGQKWSREALEAMGSGRAPLGAAKFVGGAVVSAFAPLTGAVRALITEPTSEHANEVIDFISGMSDEEVEAYRKWARENGYPLAGNILGEVLGTGVELLSPTTYAKFIKLGMPHGEKLGGVLGRAAGEERVIVAGYPEGDIIQVGGQQIRTGRPSGPPDVRPTPKEATFVDLVDDAGRPTVGVTHIDEAAPGLVERFSVKLFGEVARNPELVQRVEAARRGGKVGERLYVSIGNELFDAMRRGDLGSENLLKILDDLGVDAVEVFKQTASEGGRNLNILSQIAKQLAKQKATPSHLRKELDDIAADLERRYGTGNKTLPYKIWRGIHKGINVWRASAVSQAPSA